MHPIKRGVLYQGTDRGTALKTAHENDGALLCKYTPRPKTEPNKWKWLVLEKYSFEYPEYKGKVQVISLTLDQFIERLNALNVSPGSEELKNAVQQTLFSDGYAIRDTADIEKGELYLVSGDCVFYDMTLKKWDLYSGNFLPVY